MWDGFIGWIILLFNNFSLNGFSIHLDPCLNQISHRGLQNGDFLEGSYAHHCMTNAAQNGDFFEFYYFYICFLVFF